VLGRGLRALERKGKEGKERLLVRWLKGWVEGLIIEKKGEGRGGGEDENPQPLLGCTNKIRTAIAILGIDSFVIDNRLRF
jgi:hypothetical protein